MKRLHRIAFLVLGALCLSGSGEAAEPISYRDALTLTMAADPRIALSRQDILRAAGVLTEASGAFDPVPVAIVSGSYERGAFNDLQLKTQRQRREVFNILAVTFQAVADDLQKQLDSSDPSTDIPCREGVFDEGLEIVVIDPVTGEETIIRCTPEGNRPDETTEGLIRLLLGADPDPALEEELRRLLEGDDARTREQIASLVQQFNQNAQGFRESLRNLGITPDEMETFRASIATGLAIPLRTGVRISPAFGIEAVEDQFEGKTNDPKFGADGTPQTVTAVAGFELFIPLGKGSGWTSVTAPERSAERSLSAAENQYEQSISAQVFETALTYWSLVAARNTLQLLNESERTNRSLLETAADLAGAGEISESDVRQVEAQVLRSTAAVRRSALALSAGQVDLARVMGVDVTDIEEVFWPATPFPDVPHPESVEALSVEDLVGWAMRNRGDLRAAHDRAAAAEILVESARLGLRRRADLTLFGGYTGFGESLSFSEAFEDAFVGRWVGPSVLLTLSVDYPFQNRRAIGQYRQALSLESEADLLARNQERLIRTEITRLKDGLILAAREVAAQENAVRYHRETIDNEIVRLRLGEGTAIDVSLTESLARAAELNLVNAKVTYALLLTELRYTIGALVENRRGQTVLLPDLTELPHVSIIEG